MADPNSVYSQALSASVASYRSQAADDVTRNLPLLAVLADKGHVDTFDGGTEITEQVLFAEAPAAGWYSGPEILATNVTNVLTSANYPIKQFYAHITEDGLEDMQNNGEQAMINLIKAKMQAGMATCKNGVGVALFNSNTENSGKAIGGLQFGVSDTPTVGTVGGIDASSTNNAFWRNFLYSFAAQSVTPSATTILSSMNTAIINTNRGQDAVDLIVAGDTYFGFFDAALTNNQRFITVSKSVKAGFTSFEFKGASVIHDPNCAPARMYGLNTDFIFFRPHKERNFKIADRKASPNQDVNIYPIYFGGNLTYASRKRHFVMKA